MTNWKTYRLGDICTLNYGKALTATNRVAGDIPVYSSAGITGSHNVALVQSKGIIVGRKGTVGTVYYSDKPFYCIDTAYYILPDDEKYDFKWLYYRLKSLHLDKLNEDSAVPGLNRETAYAQEFPLPPLEEQRRIAGILGAIDDKIENNRRINTNLELQAQALFDKTFFEDNDVERNPLSDYANINPTRTLRQGVVARYIEMANLPTKGSFPSDWSYKSYGGGCKFANGDTIMARITPCLENGKTAYIDFLEEQEVAYGSTEYIVISAKSGYCPALFYFLARNKEFVDYAVGHMNGSSGRQRVGGVDIANFPMPHITLEDSNKFAEIAMPIMDVIRNNSLENRQLATLRDTLLPKLMNGEIKM